MYICPRTYIIPQLILTLLNKFCTHQLNIFLPQSYYIIGKCQKFISRCSSVSLGIRRAKIAN